MRGKHEDKAHTPHRPDVRKPEPTTDEQREPEQASNPPGHYLDADGRYLEESERG
jgi:hypothetical protein